LKVQVKISSEWDHILSSYFADKGMKAGRGGQAKSDIIHPALSVYPPIVEFIEENGLKMPECEKK